MNLKKLSNTELALIISIPSKISWNEYQKELDAVSSGKLEMNFKVTHLPKVKCTRCYLVHNNEIKGWMQVTGYETKQFKCTTTGREWSGNFIKRSGKFHKVRPIKYQSFRGFRYIKPEELNLEDL